MSIEGGVDLARWIQVVAMLLAGTAALVFILVYVRFWDPRLAAARHVMGLNVVIVLSLSAVVVGRVLPATLAVEIVKAVMLFLVAGVVIGQFRLMRLTVNGHEEAPTHRPKAADGGWD